MNWTKASKCFLPLLVSIRSNYKWNSSLLLHQWSAFILIVFLYSLIALSSKNHQKAYMAVTHCKTQFGGKKEKKKNQKQALHKKCWSTLPTSLVIGAISLFMLDCLPKCQPIYFPCVAFFSPPKKKLSVIKSDCLLVLVPSGRIGNIKTWNCFLISRFLTHGE